MTRFEFAKQDAFNMSIIIAFCIAGFLEQAGIDSFTNDELKDFMNEQADIIEEWLNGEHE